MQIHDYQREPHLDEIRECVIELQDFEHAIDGRLPRGADIVDDYMLQMFHRCRRCNGKILVAEVDDNVAGYTLVLARVQGDGVEDGNIEYALVADLIVKSRYRGTGVGRKLLAAAETYAKAQGANWLRIGALSDNGAALRIYESAGFSPLYVELEKAIE
jgi:GNAT superfamily N-acetyltransferase